MLKNVYKSGKTQNNEALYLVGAVLIIFILFIYAAQIQRMFSNAPYNNILNPLQFSNQIYNSFIKSNQMLVFEERGKPEKNLSEQSREPTNSTHI